MATMASRPHSLDEFARKSLHFDSNTWDQLRSKRADAMTSILDAHHVMRAEQTAEDLVTLTLSGSRSSVDLVASEIQKYASSIEPETSEDVVDVNSTDIQASELKDALEKFKESYPDFRFEEKGNTYVISGPKEKMPTVKQELETLISNLPERDNSAHEELCNGDAMASPERSSEASASHNEDTVPPSPSTHVTNNEQETVRDPGVSFETAQSIHIHVFCADITRVNVTGIVNPANEDLKHVGGLAKTISDAAGPQLQAQCDKIVELHGKIAAGHTAGTQAYGLRNCLQIIHAVGPRWRDYEDKERCAEDLGAVFRMCLKEANTFGFSALAIPPVSAGIFEVPLAVVAEQMTQAVLDFVSEKKPKRLRNILLVDINPDMPALVQELLQREFERDPAVLHPLPAPCSQLFLATQKVMTTPFRTRSSSAEEDEDQENLIVEEEQDNASIEEDQENTSLGEGRENGSVHEDKQNSSLCDEGPQRISVDHDEGEDNSSWDGGSHESTSL